MYIVNMKQVDLVLFGHVHNYERTCSVYQYKCKAIPIKDQKGVDIYDNRNYSAPVHAVIGMAGFALDKFSNNVTNFPFVTLFSIMIVLNCGYSAVAVMLLTLIFQQNTADLWSTDTDVDTGHDTDTPTPLIIWKNHVIQCNYMCRCRVSVGYDTCPRHA